MTAKSTKAFFGVQDTEPLQKIRLEHCMYCGLLVTSKRFDKSEYRVEHVHFYYAHDAFDHMVGAGVLCLQHVLPNFTQQDLEALKSATISTLPKDKEVHKNFGYLGLKTSHPDAAKRVEGYLKLFNCSVVPAIVKWNSKKQEF